MTPVTSVRSNLCPHFGWSDGPTTCRPRRKTSAEYRVVGLRPETPGPAVTDGENQDVPCKTVGTPGQEPQGPEPEGRGARVRGCPPTLW